MQRILPLVLVLVVAVPAAAQSVTVTAEMSDGTAQTVSVCGAGRVKCRAACRSQSTGDHEAYAAPLGLTPTDLRDAYKIPTTGTGTPTIAIIQAFHYGQLESDLSVYRQQYGLPPCTKANGCLTVVNQNGQTNNLPGSSNDDWSLTTAIDLDAASAACPRCKLVVVEASSDNVADLFVSQNAAVSRSANVIIDSWGFVPQPNENVAGYEQYFNHPGVTTFVASTGPGYNPGGGPDYPSTSAYVIAVGGTTLTRSSNARGWTESVWSQSGTSCSNVIPKPSYQPASQCARRVAVDLAAVGDYTNSPIAAYNARQGGWFGGGGNAAAAALVAAMFAATNHTSVTGADIAQMGTGFFDVSGGTIGSCGAMCSAIAGWDAPTGFGAPNAAAIVGGGGTMPPPPPGLGVTIVWPKDGSKVKPGFEVLSTVDGDAESVELSIDGMIVDASITAPFTLNAPTELAFGRHTVTVLAHDAGMGTVDQTITVDVGDTDDPHPSTNPNYELGGCSSTTSAGQAVCLVVIGMLLAMRRRRRWWWW